MNGRVRERMGNRHSKNTQGCYPCVGEDNWVVMTIRNNQEWESLCKAMGKTELINDPRFNNMDKRIENHDDIDQIISEWTTDKEKYEIFRTLQSLGIPCGPVAQPNDVLTDPHNIERGLYEEHYHPSLEGAFKYPGPMFEMSETPLRIRKLFPTLGEDNEYIYKELFFSRVSQMLVQGPTSGRFFQFFDFFPLSQKIFNLNRTHHIFCNSIDGFLSISICPSILRFKYFIFKSIIN